MVYPKPSVSLSTAMLLYYTMLLCLDGFVINPSPTITLTRCIHNCSKKHCYSNLFLSQSSSQSSSVEKKSNKKNQNQKQVPTNEIQSNILDINDDEDDNYFQINEQSAMKSSDLITTTSSNSPPTSFSSHQHVLYQEATELREKAKQLLQEANEEEQKLIEAKTMIQNDKNSNLDHLLDEFISLKTSLEIDDNTSMSDILVPRVMEFIKQNQLSTTKLISLIERINEREMNAKKIFMDSITPSSSSFQIGDVRNSKEYNQSELISLQGWIDYLINAQSSIDGDDSKLSSSPSARMKARIKELKKEEDALYQRQLANRLNQGLANGLDSSENSKDMIKGLMGKTLYDGDLDNSKNVTLDGQSVTSMKFNKTNLLSDIILMPYWVPSYLLPDLIYAKMKPDQNDLKRIKTHVLMGSQFQCTSWDSCPLAAIYRGKLLEKNQVSSVNALSGIKDKSLSSLSPRLDVSNKQNDEKKDEECLSSMVFDDIQRRMEKEGLADKIQLFIMKDPEWRSGQDSRQFEPQSVIIAVSSTVEPDQGTKTKQRAKLTTALSIVSTLYTTFAYGVSTFALNPKFFHEVVNSSSLAGIMTCMSVFFGVLGLSALHEFSHIFVAKRAGVKLGLPIPLPSFQIGTYGNITPLRSFPKNRSALFDVSLSGPLFTSLVSILMMVVGIFLTINTPTELISSLAVIPAALMKMSFLVGSITSFLAPKIMMLPLSQPIPIHPIFLIGFAGLMSSALNMLPVGRLDGGRACTAIFGRRSASTISFFTLMYIALSALTGFSTISSFWVLMVTLFQRNIDIPTRDQLSELNNMRRGVYIFSIVLTMLTLAPFPGIRGAL